VEQVVLEDLLDLQVEEEVVVLEVLENLKQQELHGQLLH
jgi:predicted RNA-binding protein